MHKSIETEVLSKARNSGEYVGVALRKAVICVYRWTRVGVVATLGGVLLFVAGIGLGLIRIVEWEDK